MGHNAENFSCSLQITNLQISSGLFSFPAWLCHLGNFKRRVSRSVCFFTYWAILRRRGSPANRNEETKTHQKSIQKTSPSPKASKKAAGIWLPHSLIGVGAASTSKCWWAESSVKTPPSPAVQAISHCSCMSRIIAVIPQAYAVLTQWEVFFKFLFFFS